MDFRAFNQTLVRLSKHPGTRVFVGVSLFITGLDDLLENLTGSEGLLNIGVYHGITILGIQQMIHSIGDMLEGIYEGNELKAARERARQATPEAFSAGQLDQLAE